MTHINWVFYSTKFDSQYPLALSRALPRNPSDHAPIMWDSGGDQRKAKNRFKFKKWWLQHSNFKELVQKVWSSEVRGVTTLDRW
jgi:hypothetical protein